jgi:arylsulfatase A-like enzyme
MSARHRAVFVCCDGLGRDWITADRTPVLHDLRARSHWCADHHAIFPSVTRVSAASIATGCQPGRHGLHGNRMGLAENGKIAVRDVGKPDFRDHMRRATGGTLQVPTLAERVAAAGGDVIAFSNVSPGAAYFLDPEHFGHVYHRAGSYGPGGAPITGSDALDVNHDPAGDAAMTRRFRDEVLFERRPAVALLWLASPDHTLHGAPLGSPAHREALQVAEDCVREIVSAVDRLRQGGEEILLMVGSDHGQETIGASIDLEAWLGEQGLGELVASNEIAVATQGTSALLYATANGRSALLGILDRLRQEPWADGVLAEDRLRERGLAAQGGLVAAINMARRTEANAYGIPGWRWVVAEPEKPAPVGCGQHGGWGPDETRPFLLVDRAGGSPAVIRRRTSLLDIAPTILGFLGLPAAGMDGSAIETVVA